MGQTWDEKGNVITAPTPAPVSAAPDPASVAPPTNQTWDEHGNSISAPAPAEPGFLSMLKNEVVGPGTVLGSAATDIGNVAEGVGQMAHGDIAGGAKKALFGDAGPHVVPGSYIEKAIQRVDPSFRGAATPTEAAAGEQGSLLNKQMINMGDQIDKNKNPIAKAVAEVAGGLTTPANVAILVGTGGLGMVDSPVALGVANKLLSAGFSAQTISQAYKHLKGFATAYQNGDGNEALYQLTHALANGTVGLLAETHAAGVDVPIATEADENIAKSAVDKFSDAKDIARNAVAKTAQRVAKATDLSDSFEDLVRKISPPSKSAAPGYPEAIVAAKPQLREIIKNNPNVSTPGDIVNAINQHIKNVEGSLRQQAETLKDYPQTRLPGLGDRVGSAIDQYFAKTEGKYTSEEQANAKNQVLNFIDHAGKDPNLFQAENIRQRFNEDTQPLHTQDPNVAPPATLAAKDLAAKIIRQDIDAGYDKLGVENVKEWRAQEAPLIDVRDQIEKAEKASQEKGTWSLFNALTKKAGWGLLGTWAGGPTGGVLAEGLGVLKDYIKDRNTNPNSIIPRLVKQAGKDTSPTGAAIPDASAASIAPVAGLLNPAPLVTPTPDTSSVTGVPAQPVEGTRATRLGLLLPQTAGPGGLDATERGPNGSQGPNQTLPSIQLPKSPELMSIEELTDKTERQLSIYNDMLDRHNEMTPVQKSVIHSEIAKIYKEFERQKKEIESAQKENSKE